MKSYTCSVADCGKPGLGRCSQCKIRYCGEECQADDWPRHLKFCLPLPALEFPESQLPGQIIDINNSTNSGNTVLAGEVSVEIQPGKPVTTKKEEEENNNVPAPVEKPVKTPEEAVMVPSSKEVADVGLQLEERKDSVSSPAQQMKMKEAISSPQMEAQEVSRGLQLIDPIEVGQIVSPAEFSISLAAEVKFWSTFSCPFHLLISRASTTSSWST